MRFFDPDAKDPSARFLGVSVVAPEDTKFNISDFGEQRGRARVPLAVAPRHGHLRSSLLYMICGAPHRLCDPVRVADRVAVRVRESGSVCVQRRTAMPRRHRATMTGS